MAQTTEGVSWRNAVIEFATDNSTWNNISGLTSNLEVSGGDREIGEAYTGSDDQAVLATGPRSPRTLSIRVVYSEATTEFFTDLEGLHTNATKCRVRWAPKGTTTGYFRYTSDTGYMSTFNPPGGDYASGDVLMVGMEFVVPDYARAAIS